MFKNINSIKNNDNLDKFFAQMDEIKKLLQFDLVNIFQIVQWEKYNAHFDIKQFLVMI